jgi:hypothetical protein
MAKGVESHLKSDAKASGAYPAEVRGFKSHPPHFACFWLFSCYIRLQINLAILWQVLSDKEQESLAGPNWIDALLCPFMLGKFKLSDDYAYYVSSLRLTEMEQA